MKTADRPLYDPEGDGKSGYARALADAGGPVPYDRVDWDLFHERLAARAELSLARLRHPHVVASRPLVRATIARTNAAPAALTWWQHMARWSPLIVSASVAAGIALIMVVRASPKEAQDTMVASAAPPAVEQLDKTRAVFESAALGRGTRWTIESALLPSTAELLIPLGKGAASR